MELEVRVVGGIESCFVSLPLTLIQNLQSTCQGLLPPVVALELRSSSYTWNVAWSGSASSSSAIEVAQQLAECISLPDHAVVQVRAIGNLPKATGVTIEPNGEDDWEVLELNAEHAEAFILKQVGIVYDGMKFPLWVHGHIVTLFLVVLTEPKNSVGSAVHLSLNTGKWFSSYKLPLPGHALIYGPAGSGKTSLAAAVAKYSEEHENILAHVVFISCSRLSLEKPSTIRQELKRYLSEALEHSPSVAIFDDLDSIVSSSFESEGSQTSASTTELVEFLTNIMDDHKAKRLSVRGIGPIAFIACVQSLENFPKPLSSPGLTSMCSFLLRLS